MFTLEKGKNKKIIDTKHKNPYTPMSIIPTLDTKRERNVILSTVRKPEVVHGSYAFNRQVEYPLYQKRPFTDIDIKSPTNRQTALDIERKLDRYANMNNYYVTKLEHDGGTTYRVHSRSRNDVVADVGLKQQRIPTRTIDKVPYETISHREKEIAKLLKTPSAEYRREKDRRMMGYIKRYKKLKRRKHVKI